jgi:hypothetical protein
MRTWASVITQQNESDPVHGLSMKFKAAQNNADRPSESDGGAL